MFVCLFTCSLCAVIHLGPDGTRLEQNAQARLVLASQYSESRAQCAVAGFVQLISFKIQKILL